MGKKIGFVLVLLLTAVLMFAGGTQEKEKGGSDDVPTIGLVHINFEHPFYRAWISEQEKCDEVFGFKTIQKSCEGSLEKEIALIESFIQMDVDLIMYNPVDVIGVEPAVKKAIQAGIPTISTHNIVDVDGNCSAVLPEYQFYSNVADILACYLDYEGKVCFMGGIIGNWAFDNRKDGFIDQITTYPNMELLDWQPCDADPTKAVNITEGWLTSYDRIDAIATIDAGIGLPVKEAIKNAGRGDEILVTGYAIEPARVDLIDEGELFLDGMFGPERNAWWLSSIAYRILQGEKLDIVPVDVPVIMTDANQKLLREKGFEKMDEIVFMNPTEAYEAAMNGEEEYGSIVK